MEYYSSIKSNSKDVLNEVYNILCECIGVNMKSILITEQLGYSGFSRLHEHICKCLFRYKIELMKTMVHKAKTIVEFKNIDTEYNTNSIEEHFNNLNGMFSEYIEKLCKLNLEYFNNNGIECEVIKCLIETLEHYHTMIDKYLMRFKQSDWLALDIHIVDTQLSKGGRVYG